MKMKMSQAYYTYEKLTADEEQSAYELMMDEKSDCLDNLSKIMLIIHGDTLSKVPITMNRHLEADHLHKCDYIICDEQGLEHCCLKRDNVTRNVIAYCCDVIEYLDKHIVPPIFDSFTYEIETPPLHYLGPHDGITTVHEHIPIAVSHVPTPKSHHPNQNGTLGWTYIGIASGIAVLLMFFIVLIAMVYILYRWKSKDRRLRYQGDQGHEVVVYHSNSGQIIETKSEKTFTNSCDGPTTSDESSPPPYVTQGKAVDTPSHVSIENEKSLKALPQITKSK